MERTPLAARQLPRYTVGEERMNMITHIVGGAFGVVVLVFALIIAAGQHDPWKVVGSAIYGASLILLYSVSATYHGLPPSLGKKVMQVIDHCTIYLLIAGTYTPILLAAIRPLYPALSWVLFGIQWGCAAGAAVFTAIDLKKYSKLSMACYIIMGWIIIIAIKPTIDAVSLAGFWWLLAGGVAYTVGAVLYHIGKKKPYFHAVFHLFVLLGSVLQAVCVLYYVMM